MSATRIDSFIDFEAFGYQKGYLRVPHSSNTSAYGWLPVPAVVVRGEPGPTVLVLGGVHGDEYEGQLAAAQIAREAAAAPVRGTLILLPSVNVPAALAASRLSPIDQLNLNRVFPGDMNGTPTQMIAHYIEEILLPRCDAVVDLHSGGGSLNYLPCVRARLSQDPGVQRRTLALVRSFGAACGVLFRPARGEPRTLSAACERKGVAYINPETGGAARIERAALSAAYLGTRRALGALGVMAPPEEAPAGPAQLLTLTPASLVYSEHDGVWEPRVGLGDRIEAGAELAAIHDLKRPWSEPHLVRSTIAGMVLCERAQAQVSVGDCLFEIAVRFDLPDADL